MTHIALVDEHILQGVAFARILGLADVSLHLDQRRVDVHRQQLLIDAVTHQGGNTLAEGALHQLVHHIAVMDQRELHIVIDQRQFLKLLNDVTQLHLVGFEELASCRHIEEDVLDHEVAARGTHVRFLTLAL